MSGRISIGATVSPVDNWKAELIDEPQVMKDSLLPALAFTIRISNLAGLARSFHNLSGEVYVGKEVNSESVELFILES